MTSGFRCRLRGQPSQAEVTIRMPSSPTLSCATNPTRHDRLLQALQTVPDPRDQPGRRYSLAGVLGLAITATVAGCRSFQRSGSGPRRPPPTYSARSGSPPAAPQLSRHYGSCSLASTSMPSTWYLGMWIFTRTVIIGEHRVIAVNSKTIRCAQRGDPPPVSPATSRPQHPPRRLRTNAGGTQERQPATLQLEGADPR